MNNSLKSDALLMGASHILASGAIFDVSVSRLFGNGDLGSEGMLSGWAVPEESHNWNDGIEASFELTVKASGGAFELVVEGTPLISEKSPTQEITLYANGFRVGYWRLADSKPQLLTTKIEPEQVFWRGKNGYVRCVWFMPNSVRPSDIQSSTDTRQLAFCFRSILVRDAS